MQITRRTFLKATTYSGLAAMIALGLKGRFTLPRSDISYQGLIFLTRNEAHILASIYLAIIGQHSKESVGAAILTMDSFVSKLPIRDRFELRAALQLVEHSPLLFHGLISRFSFLDTSNQIRCLNGWAHGAFWRRPVFCGLKELCYLAYYTQPSSWTKIGYSGPLIGERAESNEVDPRYANLVAPL